jgi:hypothetical protein
MANFGVAFVTRVNTIYTPSVGLLVCLVCLLGCFAGSLEMDGSGVGYLSGILGWPSRLRLLCLGLVAG